MIQQVYGIYDYKARSLVNGVLKCLNSDEEAERMFGALVRERGTLLSDHPEDFALVRVGEIDYDSLSFTANIGPLFSPILTGDACVRGVARARNGEVAEV